MLICALMTVLLPTVLSSCALGELYSEGEGDLNVLCTVFAPFDFSREVGGDLVSVTLLQDNGADMHSYTPTSATLDALSQADVFIYVGGESDEKWVDRAISASGNGDLITLCLMDVITPIHAELENDWSDHSHGGDEHGDEHGHSHGGDEHVWTSLKNAKLIVKKIAEVFAAADGKNSDKYSSNASLYTARLDALDAEYGQAVAEADHSLLVFADRFPFVYLLHDYHIAYKAAFSGCSTEINSSFETQIGLIRAVRDNSLPAVMTIEGGDKTLAESVANEVGCPILSLNSIQSIDREDIENGATYLDIMRANLDVLKEALG